MIYISVVLSEYKTGTLRTLEHCFLTMAKSEQKCCNHVFIEKEYYECEYCNKQFTTAYNLNRHQKGNCRENVCAKCNLRFQKSHQLRNHILICSGKQPHQCEFCAKSFLKNSNLSRHRQTHTEKCEKCGAVFYKRLPLITVYPNEAVFSCVHCAETFKSKEMLDKHIDGHMYLFPNKCEACQLAFNKKRQLFKHKQKFHPDLLPQPKNRKIYECPLCSRCFRLYRDLKTHLQSHAERGEKVFRCKTCGKGYTRKTSLKMHMIKHGRRENKPRCDICQKVFSHPYCLRAHMRIHTNQRPFHCSLCNKSFRQQGHLIRHRLTHAQKNLAQAEKKPRSCEFCDKTFKDMTGLKIHMMSHAGVRRYSCDYCSKSFLNKKTLSDHTNIHTGAKPYECQLCSEAFPRPGQLYKHKQSHPELAAPKGLQPNSAAPSVNPVSQAVNQPISQPVSQSVSQAQAMTAQQPEVPAQTTLDPASFAFVDSVVLPIQMSLQPQQLSLQNQLQNQLEPIHNPPDELPGGSRHDGAEQLADQLALSQVQLQFQSPVNMVKAHQKTSSDMPTYWHLQQSNFVQYHHQHQDLKPAMFLPPNSINLQASIAPSTIEVISNGMQQLQNPAVLTNQMHQSHIPQ